MEPKSLSLEREKYHKNLLDYCKPVIVHQTINNNTYNDNRSVNFTFCHENKNEINVQCLIEILKQVLSEYPEDQIRQMAFKIICLYDKKLKERPENNTIKISNLNSMIACIKNEIGWEMVPIDDCIHKVLTSSAKDLIVHRKELEAYGRTNRITFKGTSVPMTPQIMDEIGYIKKNGIYTDQLPGSVKTAIKINNLEK